MAVKLAMDDMSPAYSQRTIALALIASKQTLSLREWQLSPTVILTPTAKGRGRRRHNMTPTAGIIPSALKHRRRPTMSPTVTVGVGTPSEYWPRVDVRAQANGAGTTHSNADGNIVGLKTVFSTFS